MDRVGKRLAERKLWRDVVGDAEVAESCGESLRGFEESAKVSI